MENPLHHLADEWKKASPKEKLFIAGAGASVVGLALYLHSKSASSTAPGTGVAGLPSSFQPATGATGSTGTTGTSSLLGATGTPDTGTFSVPGTTDTSTPYAPPPYTGTGTPGPANPPGPPAGPVHTIPYPLQPGNKGRPPGPPLGTGHSIQPLQPGTRNQPPLGGIINAPPSSPVTYNPGATAIVDPNTGTTAIPPTLLGRGSSWQPNITTQVYSSIRHSPSIVPASTQQAAQPQVVKKARAF